MAITKIATVTVPAGGQASIDFNSIPGTYTDLFVVASVRSTRTSATDDDLRIKINGATTNYSARILRGNGSSASSITDTNLLIGLIPTGTTTGSTFGNVSVTIPNYSGATNKSLSADAVGENNATTAWQAISAGLWSQTTAITSLSIYAVNGNLNEYSSATLYGITKGSLAGVTVS